MSSGWEGSDRKSRLPENWAELVRKVKARDGNRCTWRLPRSGSRCPRPGTEVDHRVPGDDHRMWNLRLLCAFHHAQKSAREGTQAREKLKASGRRPPEGHPGAVR